MSFILAAGAVVGVVGGVMKASKASKAKKEAAAAQKKAKKDLDAKKKQYEALDTSNLNKNMENKMEDLTVNQKGMDLQNQQGQQQRANIMDQMGGAAGGSGIAALAQSMANTGQLAAQKSGAMIGDQEAANQAKSSAEAARVQDAKIAGAGASRDLQYDKTSNLMGMASSEAQAAGAAKDAASQAQGDAIAGIGTSLLGAASDRKLKKNITKIGNSPSGLNIYSFEYKDSKFGGGMFQGVMSDEIPEEAIIPMNGYDAVNYNMLDVEFKQI
tara:strand:- start:2666 stop:3478 length:813 start_codon:yes stop_codon:yes gene_type:complete